MRSTSSGPCAPTTSRGRKSSSALYEQVVAPDAKPVKLADGFTFTEGPTWLKGKLYFSDMYFKDPGKGDWTGSPAQAAG